MKVYIYTLSDPITNEVRYVGKSVNPKKRLDNHLYIKKKQHCSCWIQSLKIKGLKPIFSIIETTDKENWISREQYWIVYYKEQGAALTNHSIGGEGQTGTKQSVESNLKRSLSLKGRKLGSYSKKRKQAISDGMKGRKAWNKDKKTPFTEERISKMKQAAPKGEERVGAKLTDTQVIDIRKRVSLGEKQNKLAIEYGVTSATINKIVLGFTYCHLL